MIEIKATYKKLSIEYMIESINMRVHLRFDIDESISIEMIKKKIEKLTYLYKILGPRLEVIGRYFNEVMKKSYVRYGL